MSNKCEFLNITNLICSSTSAPASPRTRTLNWRVRPHLEYCIQTWRPYRKKDIDKLERIHRRATKMIPELRDLSYKIRLLQCGLTTLETRSRD